MSPNQQTNVKGLFALWEGTHPFAGALLQDMLARERSRALRPETDPSSLVCAGRDLPGKGHVVCGKGSAQQGTRVTSLGHARLYAQRERHWCTAQGPSDCSPADGSGAACALSKVCTPAAHNTLRAAGLLRVRRWLAHVRICHPHEAPRRDLVQKKLPERASKGCLREDKLKQRKHAAATMHLPKTGIAYVVRHQACSASGSAVQMWRTLLLKST